MSGITLTNNNNKVHWIPSYRERVITVLVKPCPKTRNKNPAEITKLQMRFSNPFLVRIIQNLCPNWRDLNEESKTSTIIQFQAQREIRIKNKNLRISAHI